MRTKPREDFSYKGPQPRRSIHSIMESDNRSPNLSSRNQQMPIGWKYRGTESEKTSPSMRNLRSRRRIGWRYGSNEGLHRSDSEVDDDDEEETDEVRDEEDYNVHELHAHIPKRAEYSSPNITSTAANVEDPSRIHQQINYSHRNYTRNEEKENSPSQADNCKYFIIIILVVSLIGYAFMSTDSEPVTNENQLRNGIMDIRNDFPSQEKDIWYVFSSGIKDTVGDPSHPSVFLMLYDEGEDTPACLALKIAKVAMNFLNATKPQPIIFDGVELGKNKELINDYGELIEEGKQIVEEHRIMIVKNIHKVPGRIAQSFHSLCDTYSPLVYKAVYLFTLRAHGASSTRHPTELAEKELEKRWKRELHEDKLKALITRITDTVIVIKPELKLSSSCANVM